MVRRKTIFIILIQLVLAILHLLDLEKLGGDSWFQFYHSYFSDIALPFGFYFLLGNIENQFQPLKKWWMKAVLMYALAASAEILQFFGVYALGMTFDPLDFLMYAVGVLLAALVDTQVFSRFLPFWAEG
jgi:hypothetical protein